MTYHSDGDLPILVSWLMTNHHIDFINLGILKHERTNWQTLKTCWRTFIEVKVRNHIWNQQLPASCELRVCQWRSFDSYPKWTDRKQVLAYHTAFRTLSSKDPTKGSLASMFFCHDKSQTISPYPLATPSKMLVSPVLAVFLQEQPNQVHSVCYLLNGKKIVLGRYSCHLEDLQLRGVSFTLQFH